MASIEHPNDPASRAFRRFREHGDPAGVTEVFDLVGQELFALAAHIARDAAEAEDLVQEAFLAALAGARRFDPSRAVTPWLVGILVKEAQKARRGRARREGPRAERSGPRTSHDGAGDGNDRTAPPNAAPLALALTGEVRRAITLALAEVPARYREVLRSVLEDGIAPTALAATLGRAPGTVRMQLHRGLELLRKALPRTLAPALVPPLVSALALELGAGRGLAAIRADLARRAALEGPGLALAGAGLLVTPSLPLLGVVVMQTKVLAAVAAAALAGVALFVQNEQRALPALELESRHVTATERALVADASAASDSMQGARSFERSPVASTDAVAAQASASTTATLTVRVVDEVGVGVAGASVKVQPKPDPVTALRLGAAGEFRMLWNTTREDGRVTFEVRAGFPLELRGYRINDTSEGVVLLEALAGGARAEATINVQTLPDRQVTGRVVDAVSGEPIAGIHVHLQHGSGIGTDQPKRPLPPRAEPDAVTDAAGEFRVPAMSWRRCFALCTGAGWSPRLARLNRAAAVGEIEDTPITIALLRAARIEGTVTGTRGPTVAMAVVSSISLVDYDQPSPHTINPFSAQFELEAAVDGGGRFTFESAPVRAELSLSLADAATREVLLQEPDEVELVPGTTHAVTWSLGAGGRLVVQVRTEDGAPAPDEELWLLTGGEGVAGETESYWSPTYRAHTDGAGSATFDGLQPGSWLVALAPARTREGAEYVRYAVWATVPANGALVPVELTLYKGLYISGTVRAPDGTLRAAAIIANGPGFDAVLQVADCKDGAFRIGPLKPGRYSLEAQGRSATETGGPPLANSSIVQAEAGAKDVELWLGDSCDVVLTAVDRSSGAPVPARFGCWRVGDNSTWSGGYESNVTFSGRSPGPHRVLARTEDGRIGLVELELVAGRNEIRVEVAPGGRVRVRHAGSAGRLSASLEGALGPLGVGDARPTEVAELLAPAGEYTLHILVREPNLATQTWTTFRDEHHKVTLTAGGVVELELVQ